MTHFWRAAVAWLLLLGAGSARAEWRVATSTHFAVYAEGSGNLARDTAERLEKFQFVLRFLSGATAASSPMKIKIFLVADPEAVAATLPFGGDGILGYYSSTIRGPFSIMSRIDARGSKGSRGEVYMADMKAQQVLFHELTHHFSRQYFPAAYPTWYSEGFAEYMGSMEIGTADRVVVGTPVRSRYASFEGNDWLPVDKLLTAKSYSDLGSSVYLLYAEGWLLVHYLTNTDKRPGQLKTYLSLINKGLAFDEAARQAFGDLGKLDGELRQYSSRGKLNTLVLPFKKLEAGPITIRQLGAAEEALLPFDIRLYAGIPAGDAGTFANRVASAAARYPQDPEALRVLYEAQRLAGRRSEAEAVAKRWIELAPGDPLAETAQADARAEALAAAGNHDAAQWTALRKRYADAAKKAPDEPRILRSFYQSYVRQGITPPEPAQNALYAAFELLPQFADLRIEVAADFEMRGMIDEAIAVIRPEAYLAIDPSELNARERRKRDAELKKYREAGEREGETAREMLNRLETKKKAAAGK